MSRLVHDRTVDATALARLLRPRRDVVAEREVGDGAFAASHGPVRRYERRVEVLDRADGAARVRETVSFELAVPYWWPLLVVPFKWVLRRPPRDHQPWWAPPERLDARAAQSLGVLCAASVVAGYLGTLISQTITFAADEFDAGDAAQGAVLAAVRVGILLSLLAVTAADRRGRRPLLVATLAGGCVLAATGALVPSLAWLGVSQTLARGCSIALALLIGIVAAEEVPSGSRAYAVSVLAMTAALGAGMAVWALPLADLGPRAWRLLYLIPLLVLPLVPGLRRRLPESRRFTAPHGRATLAGHGRRFWLLAAAAFLVQMFLAPASQFQNEFLRDERGFSAARITLFTLATNTPAGIGIIVAGRLADVRGRRVVGAVGLAGGAGATVAMYLATGWPLWAWSVVGAIVGAATVPALGVYGPELFPTSMRGRANGVVGVLSVVGSSAGLLAVGALSSALGGVGPAIAVLGVAPLAVAVLVLALFPETAHVELERLNPEDAPAPSGPAPPPTAAPPPPPPDPPPSGRGGRRRPTHG